MLKLSNPKKWEDLLQFVAVALFIILVNIHASRHFFRLDLTQEQRYTISDASKQILNQLPDVVYIEIYLEGELNSGFKRLQKSVQETLEEFRVYGGDRIQYRFVNPDEAPTQKERERFYQQLIGKGVQPTNLYENDNGKRVQKVIFPAAIVSFGNKETAVQLLKGNRTASPQEQLNQSVEGIEYEMISAIKKLTETRKASIAIIEGHQELGKEEMSDLYSSLEEFYAVNSVDLRQRELSGFDAVIVAQPKKPYSELEKYKLDQFIMHGGKALFFVDMVQMNLDSIAMGGAYAFGYNLNLDDLLFRYGVRINMNLLQDLQMGRIIVNVGRFGSQANLQPVPWPYYIALNRFAGHPVVRNLNGIYARFASSMDTVKANGIKKTPLVFSNQYSRLRRAPTMVSLDELKMELNPALYQQQFLPVAYLLEGSFQSLYRNRYPPEGADASRFKEQGLATKILVCGDGDFPKSEFNPRTRQPWPLGFDPVTKQTFSNKDFILNTLAFMLDEKGIISTRNKEITLRPLDNTRIQEEKTYWQVLNIGAPVSLVLLFGLLYHLWRKRKHTRF